MSWFSRKKSFEEEGDILADDFEAEFNGIAGAFNGLFEAAKITASGATELGAGETKDIAGATVTVTPAVASLMLVVTNFVTEGVGYVAVDGVDQDAPTANSVFCISLAAGSHTVKLRAKNSSAEPSVMSAKAGFLYLLIPDPEP